MIIGFFIVIIGIMLLPYFNVINPEIIYISESKVSEQSISLTGGIIDSASLYKGYKVDYRDHALYVQIQGNLLSLHKSSGDFHLNIKNKYKDLHKIYIQGSDKTNLELVWEKR
ncbi:hypothetical protein [Paenibacillus gallinarum]|uniref:Uncharacterized protein n=1 Tax=Paenibacillus gallinarum TaxID=2762232 RepID=A0ABR8SVE6_9BACL|nr:hypothetical protein [Paenibacillus gallinarum]MBD7967472.1 hypothetical protein [Paenibacillus gallinarum]